MSKKFETIHEFCVRVRDEFMANPPACGDLHNWLKERITPLIIDREIAAELAARAIYDSKQKG